MTIKVAETLRMSQATAAINTGDGNNPKLTRDGQLYGSSQSTKRQIMEASGVYKDTRNLRLIADEYKIPYTSKDITEKDATEDETESDNESVEAAEIETKSKVKKSQDKHSVPWDDDVKRDLEAIMAGNIKTFEDLKNWAIKISTPGARVYSHFNTLKVDGKAQTNRIDGAYGTTGHRGLSKGRTAEDPWSASSSTNPNESIGQKKLALEEWYWSRHQLKFKDPTLVESLKKILVAAATKVLIPRANKNGGNTLSCVWSITVIAEHTNINWPPVESDTKSCCDYLQRLMNRNKIGFRYIVYTFEDVLKCSSILGSQGKATDDAVQFEQFISAEV